jgi:uracil-DNA glycosylase
VPWLIHAPGARNRAPRPSEVRDGLAALPGFLDLLPELRAAVLLGHVARRARPVLEAARPGLPVWEAPHPSPTICCTDPAIPGRIVDALGAAWGAVWAAAHTERAAAEATALSSS